MARRALIGCLIAVAAVVPAAVARAPGAPLRPAAVGRGPGPQPGPGPGGTGSVYGSATANRATARRQARALLAGLTLAPGTTPSATEPAGDGGALARIGYDEATPNLFDAHRFATSAASPSAVLRYVAAHLPRSVLRDDSGSIGGGPGGVTERNWSLAPVPGTTQRVVSVSATALPGGATGVRLDGEAVWMTPRPGWERIPGSVRAITFSGRGQTLHGGIGPVSAPQTITGARVRRVVALLNGLEVVQPFVTACPLALPVTLTLRLLGSGGRQLARAVESSTGCASVALRIGARRGPSLQDDPGVTDELVRVGAIRTCTASQLTGSATRAPGSEVQFELRNRSDRLCRLEGFPRVALSGPGGPVRTRLRDLLKARPFPAVLDPDASAGFAASYTSCAGPRVTQARVALPHVASPLTIALKFPLRPCGGRLTVAPVA